MNQSLTMPRNTKELEGRLRISRPQGGRFDGNEEKIRLEVTDSISRVPFLEVDVGLAEMMRALTNAEARCKFTLRWAESVGMLRQHKTVSVYVPRYVYPGTYDREAYRTHAAEACAVHEEDGWRADVDDAMNIHNRTAFNDDGATYSVRYTRLVEPDAPNVTPNDEPF